MNARARAWREDLGQGAARTRCPGSPAEGASAALKTCTIDGNDSASRVTHCQRPEVQFEKSANRIPDRVSSSFSEIRRRVRFDIEKSPDAI
jgi:hypothetical protein